MKKLLLALLSITLLISCQDPVIGPGFPDDFGNNGEENFQVDFDSQTFVADQITATFLNGIINITGLRGVNNEYVLLTINANSPGTYQLGFINQTTTNVAAYGSENGAIPFITAQANSQASFGEVIITEIDTANKLLSGTFEFTGHQITIDSGGNQVDESKEFTNGLFTNIEYSDDLGTGNNTDDTFFAKIDGVEFVEDSFFGISTNLAGMSTIAINAVNNNLVSIGFSLPSDITAGTYNLTSLGEYIGQYNISTIELNGAKSGSITITSHNETTKHIIATFDFIAGPFVGTTEYAVTDGEFELTYQ